MTRPNIHAGLPLVRAGKELRAAKAACVLVHGRAQTPDVMTAIAERLALPELAYVAPSASDRSWYPKGFMADRLENEPHLSDALARLHDVVTEIEAVGIDRDKIALVGFSQGACLASELFFREPHVTRTLVAFTGGLIGPAGTTWGESRVLAGTRVLLTTSDVDAWVPLARVEETEIAFRRAGAEVRLHVERGREHLVSDPEIALAREVLTASLFSSSQRSE